ncbi:hypothetical protein J6590_042263 [Homalodisca vitripennis]|nr:hypothetical protein J6590_042263 [Homalodisca vitripennis]
MSKRCKEFTFRASSSPSVLVLFTCGLHIQGVKSVTVSGSRHYNEKATTVVSQLVSGRHSTHSLCET